MKNMKYYSIALMGIILIIGSVAISGTHLNPTESIEPYDIPIHNIYPYYTYDELQDGSPFIVSGQIISISESKWSTSDGKKPEGIVITRGEDERGKYTDFSVDIKRDEFIYTDVVLKINTVYKGDLKEDETVIIRLLTGTADNWRMSDAPGLDVRNYEEGGTYLFFLGPYVTYSNEEIPNFYEILTPRGALMKQESSPVRRVLVNQNQEIFVNFEGEQFTPQVLFE